MVFDPERVPTSTVPARPAAVLEAIAVERDIFAARLQSPEAKEAFSAFFDKRKPDFSRF